MKRVFLDLLCAIGFLSRITVPSFAFEQKDCSTSRFAGAFPLAGFVIALPGAALLFFFHNHGFFVCALAVASNVLITGALHEDGLADSCDGLGGGHDRDRALSIMKDSRMGAYGSLALVFCVLLRVSALFQLSQTQSPLLLAAAFIAAAIFSRGAMLLHWSMLSPAKSSGLGATAGALQTRAILYASVSTLLALVAAFALFNSTALLIALGGGFLLIFIWSRFTKRKIGGYTGDTLGAMQQIFEIAFLGALALQ